MYKVAARAEIAVGGLSGFLKGDGYWTDAGAQMRCNRLLDVLDLEWLTLPGLGFFVTTKK